MRLYATMLMLAASRLLAQDPMEARAALNRGVSEFRSGNYSAAVAEFQRAVQSDPSFVVARLYLGTALMQQYIPGAQSPGNQAAAAAAEQEFRKVLDMDPGNTTAMSYLASLNVNQKKWDDAEGWYDKLTVADPGNAVAWYSKGFIAWSRWYPAYSEARKSLGMQPADPGPMPPGAVKSELKARYSAVIDSGLRALQQGLLIDPKYDDAMAYMNLLIRERADLLDTAEEYRRDIALADEWVDMAMETKRAKSAGMGNMVPPPPPSPPGTTGVPARIRVSGPVQANMLVTSPPPIYPPEAKRAGVQGSVQLSVVISREGKVTQVSYLSGEAAFADAAMEAVRQWVYKPTLLNGEPVEVTTQVEVNFRL
jgi:TonB family protein